MALHLWGVDMPVVRSASCRVLFQFTFQLHTLLVNQLPYEAPRFFSPLLNAWLATSTDLVMARCVHPSQPNSMPACASTHRRSDQSTFNNTSESWAKLMIRPFDMLFNSDEVSIAKRLGYCTTRPIVVDNLDQARICGPSAS